MHELLQACEQDEVHILHFAEPVQVLPHPEDFEVPEQEPEQLPEHPPEQELPHPDDVELPEHESSQLFIHPPLQLFPSQANVGEPPEEFSQLSVQQVKQSAHPQTVLGSVQLLSIVIPPDDTSAKKGRALIPFLRKFRRSSFKFFISKNIND